MFVSRRDTAIIMLLLDTGACRSELLNLSVADVSFEYDVITVLGRSHAWGSALPLGVGVVGWYQAVAQPLAADR